MKKMADMAYHCGIRVKLYPSNEQKRIIAVNDGAARAVYNHLVAVGNERYRLSKTAAFVPVYQDRLGYLDSVSGCLKNIKNALPYLYGPDVDDQAVANASKNYFASWKNRKDRHSGVPVFKKKSSMQSYQTNAHYYFKDTKEGHNSNVWFLDKNHVTLPKLGRIRFGGSSLKVAEIIRRQEVCDIRIGTITVRRDSVGEYWASFQRASDTPFFQPLPKTGSERGIDLNLIELVNGSDGQTSANMHFYREAQASLAKQQHKLSRMAEHAKKEGRELHDSRNYQKQRRKVAYIHRKVARQREDYLHVLSKREVENQDFIAAEDLKVKNLVRNYRLAKAVSDAGWGSFLTKLSYKAEAYGKEFVQVPPRFTSQTCSACGYVLKLEERLSLSDREWVCPACHTQHHRDTNAARVVLQIAKEKAATA